MLQEDNFPLHVQIMIGSIMTIEGIIHLHLHLTGDNGVTRQSQDLIVKRPPVNDLAYLRHTLKVGAVLVDDKAAVNLRLVLHKLEKGLAVVIGLRGAVADQPQGLPLAFEEHPRRRSGNNGFSIPLFVLSPQFLEQTHLLPMAQTAPCWT